MSPHHPQALSFVGTPSQTINWHSQDSIYLYAVYFQTVDMQLRVTAGIFVLHRSTYAYIRQFKNAI